jgi:protein-S-isoprenylcysteine O-methyltransferase Ste14
MGEDQQYGSMMADPFVFKSPIEGKEPDRPFARGCRSSIESSWCGDTKDHNAMVAATPAAVVQCASTRRGREADRMAGALSVGGFVLMLAGLVALILRGAVLSTLPDVIVLQALAVALMVWARIVFGRRSFHATASPTGGGLVTSGPYRFIRHPIYTAVCLFTWACVIGHPTMFSFSMATLVTAGALVRMVTEEGLLLRRYPEYASYARRTRRMVPYVF